MQNGPGARVEVDAVGKRYLVGDEPLVALDRVTLDVEPGEILALMGPSGSGKSTLLHLVGAMDAADEGRIDVGGFEVTALDRSAQVDYRRRIGFVFQRFHLLPALTVLDNVAAPLLPYKTGFDKLEKARKLVAAVGLAGREESLPSRLSGGEQQRVAIARALVNDPILLLADEPTGNLDSHTGAEIVELLLQLREQHRMTVIVATHNPLVAARCDRIARLQDGRIVDILSVLPELEPEEVLERITRLEAS
jgi:putative ABC transport system ATP-binding protein